MMKNNNNNSIEGKMMMKKDTETSVINMLRACVCGCWGTVNVVYSSPAILSFDPIHGGACRHHRHHQHQHQRRSEEMVGIFN